jgi:hypothetical protein
MLKGILMMETQAIGCEKPRTRAMNAESERKWQSRASTGDPVGGRELRPEGHAAVALALVASLTLGWVPGAMAQAIGCGATVERTLTSGADTDLFAFNGLPGEMVSITVAEDGNTTFFNPRWRLFDGNASPVALVGQPGQTVLRRAMRSRASADGPVTGSGGRCTSTCRTQCI